MFGRKKLRKRIEQLETQVRRLENMHATTIKPLSWETTRDFHTGLLWEDAYGRIGYYGDRQLTGHELSRMPRHPQPVQVDFRRITNVPPLEVDTDRVSKVTFEELARLVVDHKPIRREEEVKAKCISEYTEDSTTKITIHE